MRHHALTQRICVGVALCLTAWVAPAGAAPPSPEDMRAIQSLFQRYSEAVANNDLTALAQCYERDTPTLRDRLRKAWAPLLTRYPKLVRSSELLNVGVTENGALVRERFQIFGKVSNSAYQRVRHGTWDVLLRRVETPEGSATAGRSALTAWRFAELHWFVPDVTADLSAVIQSNAHRPAPGVLHVVVELRGGQWYPLRQLWWDGAIVAGSGRRAGVSADELLPALTALLNQYYQSHAPIEAHLMIQRDQYGWLLVGSTAVARHRAAPLEQNLRTLRQQVGADFSSATAHKRLADALFAAGEFLEAAAAYERAEALQPGSVERATLAAVRAKLPYDPQVQLEKILAFEEKVGIAPDHPQVRIQQLAQAQRMSPQRVDVALQLGIEMSRLGDEQGAAAQLHFASGLLQSGRALASNAEYTQVLLDFLQERLQLATLKPPQILRSPLFTVRFQPGDYQIIPVLSALERAQHVVYTSFGIPMSNTEVLLMGSQRAFQDYVNRFPDQRASEFAQAVTITRTLVGPGESVLISDEEIVTFSGEGKDHSADLAHEYGHVAVRRFTNGAAHVPVWLNEGIACVVQGGYPDYVQRCQQAAATGQLLPMEELLAWRVDGERAFLAYSQANAIVQYIITQRGKKALLQILQYLGRGMSADQAFMRTLNLTQAQLFQRWAATLKTQ
ncbi:MAG: peptidase MA family metallohydrolase [Abditibacteriales bacterium]|nr:peptidase MA family metallohydrolase [Abditibacteriales bacterium]MDW8366265.1 peptidase MA family metallohydrolase [Abditibacteriales bacterium]